MTADVLKYKISSFRCNFLSIKNDTQDTNGSIYFLSKITGFITQDIPNYTSNKAVIVPNAIQIMGCKPIFIPFSRPIKVKNSKPIVSNKTMVIKFSTK
jgi:hypothetical protein